MDNTAKEFWDACERGELTFQRCDACLHIQNYPRPFCAQCGSDAVSF